MDPYGRQCMELISVELKKSLKGKMSRYKLPPSIRETTNLSPSRLELLFRFTCIQMFKNTQLFIYFLNQDCFQ